MPNNINSRLLKCLQNTFRMYCRDGIIKNEDFEQERNKKLLAGFKLVNNESNRLIGWALLIIGGSLLAIIQKDYFQLDGVYRYTYLLFIVGWLLLCSSIYYGELITRNYIASIFVPEKYIDGINQEINDRFGRQINLFVGGVIVFAIWMILFLIFRIFDFNCDMP